MVLLWATNHDGNDEFPVCMILKLVLPLVFFLLSAGPVSAQNQSGNDKAVKSDFSEPGKVETDVDPVDYRSGDFVRPQPIPPPPNPVESPTPQTSHALTPPAENKSGEKISATEAVPKLNAIKAEFLRIAHEAIPTLRGYEKWPGGKFGIGITPFDFDPGVDVDLRYDYFAAHFAEFGIREDWIERKKENISKDPYGIKSFFQVNVLNGQPLAIPRSQYFYELLGTACADLCPWTAIAGHASQVYGPLYCYHFFVIQDTLHFAQENGYVWRDALEDLEKGFEGWKENERAFRELAEKYYADVLQLLQFEDQAHDGKCVLGILDVLSLSVVYGDGSGNVSILKENEVVPFPLPAPDPAKVDACIAIQGFEAECKPVILKVWQMEYEISQMLLDLTVKGHQCFFRCPDQAAVRKVPGAGPDEKV